MGASDTLRTNYAGAAVTNWYTHWPLPVGRRVVEKEPFLRRVDGWAELMKIVPFEEDEEALWALRVERLSRPRSLRSRSVSYRSA